jgi:hypothetical protein
MKQKSAGNDDWKEWEQNVVNKVGVKNEAGFDIGEIVDPTGSIDSVKDKLEEVKEQFGDSKPVDHAKEVAQETWDKVPEESQESVKETATTVYEDFKKPETVADKVNQIKEGMNTDEGIVKGSLVIPAPNYIGKRSRERIAEKKKKENGQWT